MNFFKKFFAAGISIVSILMLNNSALFAQDAVKQILSPAASAMAKINTNDVDLFTGTPKISMSFYSHIVDNYDINVGLRYIAAGGVRVSDRSGNVGLGWNLMGASSISRHVRGVPDEMKVRSTDLNDPISYINEWSYGYIHSGNLTNPSSVSLVAWDSYAGTNNTTGNIYDVVLKPFFGEQKNGNIGYNMGTQLMDTEPDIFEFNINGKSGKFVFDRINGQIVIHQIPWMGLKIEYRMGYKPPVAAYQYISSTSSHSDDSHVIIGFTITDTDNTKYVFDAFEFYDNRFTTSSVSFKVVNLPPDDYGTEDDLDLVLNGAPTILDEFLTTAQYLSSGFYRDDQSVVNQYTSGWFLTKVITPNGQIIDYEYNTDVIRHNPNDLQIKNPYLKYRAPGSNGAELLNATSLNSIYVVTQRLSKISSDDFEMNFIGEQSKNENNRGLNISRIDILNKDTLIKSYGFSYGISISDGVTSASSEEQREYRRPILLEVSEYDKNMQNPRLHKFDYNLAFYGGGSGALLPNTKSYSVDQWGFYNGANNVNLIPKLYIYPDISLDNRRFRVDQFKNYTGREYILPGAERASNSNYMSIGMLKKITYPTGGSAEYVFEPNTYLENDQSYIGPGLRIKTIKLNSGVNEEVIEYQYEDNLGRTTGRLIAKPVVAKILSHTTLNPQNTIGYYQRNLSRYSDSQAEISSLDNRLIGYDQVTEYRAQNGKNVYYFSNKGMIGEPNNTVPDDDGGLFGLPIMSQVKFGTHRDDKYQNVFNLNPAHSDTYPFAPATNYDWNRGLLIKRQVYNEGGSLLEEQTNTYKNITPKDRFLAQTPYRVKGIKIGQMIMGRPSDPAPDVTAGGVTGITLRVVQYDVLTDIARVISSTSKSSYFPNTNLAPVNETVDYHYSNALNTSPTKVARLRADGKVEYMDYYYPSDLVSYNTYNVNNVLNKMLNFNLVDKPIVIRKKVDDTYISETYNLYDEINSNGLVTYLPVALYEKENGINIEPNSNVDRKARYVYDYVGNVIQYIDKSNPPVSVFWGYNNKFPVLKAKGILYSGILDQFNQSHPTLTDIQNGSLSANSFANLRLALPKVQFENYTYNFMGLMTSKTDIRGLTEYYSYDNFNRLQTVRDHEGKIIKTYDYNFKR